LYHACFAPFDSQSLPFGIHQQIGRGKTLEDWFATRVDASN
jgi:hypothetical protein